MVVVWQFVDSCTVNQRNQASRTTCPLYVRLLDPSTRDVIGIARQHKNGEQLSRNVRAEVLKC